VLHCVTCVRYWKTSNILTIQQTIFKSASSYIYRQLQQNRSFHAAEDINKQIDVRSQGVRITRCNLSRNDSRFWPRGSRSEGDSRFAFRSKELDHIRGRFTWDLETRRPRAFKRTPRWSGRAINFPFQPPFELSSVALVTRSYLTRRAVSFTYFSPRGNARRGLCLVFGLGLIYIFQSAAEDQPCLRGDGCGDWRG